MTRRFFVERPIVSGMAELIDAEAHHLLHVLRAKPGDEVTVFDGRGGEYQATVDCLGRSSATLALGAFSKENRERRAPLLLGVALPKGDRQKWLVEKAVEIGVTGLVPIVTTRGVAQPSGNALDRLRRAVIEASKQCGRNLLMSIGEPRDLSDWLSEPSTHDHRWLAHPGGDSIVEVASPANGAASETTTYLAIGPEGGFADEEIELARAARWRLVDLGPRLLRIETAAIVLATAAGE